MTRKAKDPVTTEGRKLSATERVRMFPPVHAAAFALRWIGLRDRLRCPECRAVGTWKPHGTTCWEVDWWDWQRQYEVQQVDGAMRSLQFEPQPHIRAAESDYRRCTVCGTPFHYCAYLDSHPSEVAP